MKLFAVAAVAAALALVASGSGATRSTQRSCIATLTFDEFHVFTDTDENPPYPKPDKWTVHVYAYVNGILGKWNEGIGGYLRADSGDTIRIDYAMIDHVV